MEVATVESDTPPTPMDVLRWCAAVAPAVWFPSEHCQRHGIDRQQLDEPLWLLRQAGLLQVADWVKGRGQGFTITPIGQVALRSQNPIQIVRGSCQLQEPKEQPPSGDEDNEEYRPVYVDEFTTYDRGEMTREAFIKPKRPVFSLLFLWANIIWFLFGLVFATWNNFTVQDYLTNPSPGYLVRIGAAFGPFVYYGDWWRLMSCAFVHVGLLHLLLNTLALYSLGPMVETFWPRWKFGVLYLLSALCGSCLAVGLNPTGALAGASGAIWGMIIAVTVWLIRFRHHLPNNLGSDALRQFLFIVGLNAVFSFAPSISWEGHLGGAIAGVVVSLLLNTFQPGASQLRKGLSILGLLLFTAAALGFVLGMMRYSERWGIIRQPQLVTSVPIDPQELKSVIESVALPRVAELHQAALGAMITRTPEVLERTRLRSVELQNAAERLRKLLGPSNDPAAVRYRQYLIKLMQFNSILDKQLRAPAFPSAAESKELGELRRQVDQAWNELAASAEEK